MLIAAWFGVDGRELLLYVANDWGGGMAGARMGSVPGDREGGEDGQWIREPAVRTGVPCAAQGRDAEVSAVAIPITPPDIR